MARTDTIAIALYARTGHTEGLNDKMSDAELSASRLPSKAMQTADERYLASALALCALRLEKRWGAGFRRIVWFVASDHLALRNSLAETYDERHSGGRVVFTTSSKGRHSKPFRDQRTRSAIEKQLQPETRSKVDFLRYQHSFNEAWADWFLLSHADLAVIAPAPHNSYARTAFAYGARTRSVFTLPTR